MIYKKLLCCVSLLFLFSCTLMTNTAPTPAQLEDLLKQNLVILPDSNFENLPSDLKENEIIFLGEYEHRSRPLSLAASKLAVYLASHRPVVYALESRYGSHPLFEAVSLGKEKATIDPMLYPEAIQAFNSSQTADKKILLTAIDIEHTIYHTKSYTVHFLQELAQRSTSDVARRIIQNHIPQLTTQDTFDKVNRYLEELKGVFLQHLGTFSPEDQDEILFSLDLLQASNQFYQYISDWRIRRFYLTPRGWNIRAQYFKKTIERAYHKAQRRKAILLCRVGAPHASLTDKYYEALYFAKKYSPTKGKVVSIGLVPVYYNIRETNDNVTGKHNDIDSIVKILMKGDECSYLSLSKLQENTNNSFKWSKYYSNSGPKYDGLLFVKIEKSSN